MKEIENSAARPSAMSLHARLSLLMGVLMAGLMGWIWVSWPVQGPSAFGVSLHLGLESQPVLGHPYYRGLLGLVARIPIGSLGLRVNGLAWLCTLGAMLLFQQVLYRFYRITDLKHRPAVCAVCAAVGTWMAATSLPVLWLASRAAPLSFHLLLFMGLLMGMAVYLRRREDRLLYGFWVLYGVGAVEYTTLLVLGPVALWVSLAALYRFNRLSWRRLATLAAAAAAGLASSVGVALVFVASPAAELTAFKNGFQAFRALWAGLLRGALQGVPRTGWLLVLMVGVLPLLCCLWSALASREVRMRQRLHFAAMNGALAIIVLAALANAPIAPWRLLGDRHVLVLPYLAMAAVLGYAVGFAYLFREGIWGVRPAALKVGRALLAVAVVFVCLMPLKNVKPLDVRDTRGLWAVAREVADWLDGRDVLLVQDHSNHLLRLAAFEQGVRVTLLVPSEERNPFYQRALVRALPDARLRALAEVSTMALTKEILAERPDLSERMGFLGNSGLLAAAGYVPVPQGLFYAGRRGVEGLEVEALLARHEAMWARLVPALKRDEARSGRAEETLRGRRWYTSRLANDLGVLMEFTGHEDLARAAYRGALAANEKNLSALLNLAVLGGEGEEDAWLAVTELARDIRMRLQELVLLCGHLRSPEALQFLRDLWMAPAEAEAEAEAGPAPDARVAELYRRFAHGEYDQALALSDKLVAAHPDSVRMWWMRGLLAERLGREDVWQDCWQKMMAWRQEWPMFLMIEGRRHLGEGDVESARMLLARAAARWPGNAGLLEAVAQLELSAGRPWEAREAVRRLLTLDPSHEGGTRLLGLLEYQEGRLERAETAMRAAAERHPSAANFNNLAWMLRQLGRHAEAQGALKSAFRFDADHVPAMDTQIVIWMDLEEFDAAAELLARVEQLAPTLPALPLRKARMALLQGDVAAARLWVEQADARAEAYAPDLARELEALRSELATASP